MRKKRGCRATATCFLFGSSNFFSFSLLFISCAFLCVLAVFLPLPPWSGPSCPRVFAPVLNIHMMVIRNPVLSSGSYRGLRYRLHPQSFPLNSSHSFLLSGCVLLSLPAIHQSSLSLSFLSEWGGGVGYEATLRRRKQRLTKIILVPNTITSHLCPSSCHALALAWTFSYLLFFRALSLLGLPTPTPFTNAVQLLLTLKVRLGKRYCLFFFCLGDR